MFNIGFKNNYKVVHVCNEFGKHVVGGAGTYMNELYKYHNEDTGFIYINYDNEDISIDDFEDNKDILVMSVEESEKLKDINCDILVAQFYDLEPLISNSEVLANKKLVYVVHSVPTPEPMPPDNVFGGNYELEERFIRLCELSTVIICVSEAEKNKLSKIYPYYSDKIHVVYNGITQPNKIILNENYKSSRKVFGYIGRTDYRKGIIEALEVIRDIDNVELRLACPNNDNEYLREILLYINAAKMWDKVKFCGWCMGERKQRFFNSLDALLVPSLYEPFGYVVIEGMLKGLPIISANNGGTGEILQGYKYKYNPYKYGYFKNTLKTFIDDPNEVIAQQQEILLDNLKRFTAKEMSDNYNKLFNEM